MRLARARIFVPSHRVVTVVVERVTYCSDRNNCSRLRLEKVRAERALLAERFVSGPNLLIVILFEISHHNIARQQRGGAEEEGGDGIIDNRQRERRHGHVERNVEQC